MKQCIHATSLSVNKYIVTSHTYIHIVCIYAHGYTPDLLALVLA